jgi:hypothetical protein
MLALIFYIAIIGLLVWAVTYFIPMPPKFQTGVYVLGGLLALLVCLRYFGVVVPHFPR